MAQYEELKQLIDAQAAEIKSLKEKNTKLMNVVESTFIYNYNDDNVPEWAQDALTAAMKCGAVNKINIFFVDFNKNKCYNINAIIYLVVGDREIYATLIYWSGCGVPPLY